jgi:uncharacterized damage-inducible protein DinB
MSKIENRRLQELAVEYWQEYLDKIEAAVAALSEDEVWWRASPSSNSIGNLLLHLAGNLGQWVIAGLAGESHERRRSLEFAAGLDGETPRVAKAEALARLRARVAECVAVARRLPAAELDRVRRIQKYELDGWKALFHAVEHMSYHAGQIVQLAKQLRPEAGLDFYPQHRGE